MKKIFAFLLISIWFSQVFSQVGNTLTGQSFTINAPITEGTTYKASEFVDFVPGAEFKATLDKELHAFIDPYMIFPPTTGVTGGPNAGDNGVVGTIEGQGSVGPMGNFIYTIPLKLPECIPGMTPSLSLVYNSAGGDGYLGHGWSLGGLSSISRVPSNLYYDGAVDPVDFDDTDRLSLDGSRLMMTGGTSYWSTDAEYQFEAENGMKVVRFGDGFKVYSPDGKISYYGTSNESKVWKANASVQWFLDKVEDVFGNTIKIEYYHSSTGGEFSVVPHKILYNYNSNIANFSTAVYNVEFVYMAESPFVRYSNQTAYLYDRVIAAIVIKKGETEVSHYDLFYGYPMAVGMTTIDSISYATPSNEYSFNPTKFLYSNDSEILLTAQQTSGMAYSSSGNGNTADYLPGDFNGDGYTDYVRVKWYFDQIQTNVKVISGWDLFINDKNGGFILRNQPQNPNNIVLQTGWNIHCGGKIVPMNIDGDNKTDIVIFYDYDNKDWVTGQYDDYFGDNKIEILIATGNQGEFIQHPAVDLIFGHRITEEGILPVDIDGDGLDDLILNTLDADESHHQGHEFAYVQFYLRTQFNDQNAYSPFYIPRPHQYYNQYRGFKALNFDGDNKLEISFQDDEDDNSDVLTLDPETYSLISIHSGLSKWKYSYYGDYNGDGISDLLQFIPEPEWNSQTGRWLICYGTGTTYTYPEQEVFFGINVKPGGHLSNSSWTYLSDVVYLVGDYNGDGMADIMESYYDKRLSSNEQYVRKIYFSQKGFAAPQFVKSYNSSWENRAFIWQSSYASDINGDNKEDVVSIMLGELHFYSFGAGEPEGLLKEIENGFGLKNTITYLPGKSSSVYSNQLLNLYEETNSNIFNSSMPMYVTKQQKIISGASLISDEVYHYFSGMFHRKGKGFLGFDMIRVENSFNNIRSLTNTRIFTNDPSTYSFVMPETDYQVSYQIQEGNYINYNWFVNDYYVYPDKRYRITQSNSLTKTRDPLGGYFTGTSRVTNTFDALGQLTHQVECRSVNNYEFNTPEDNFEHRTVVTTAYLTPENNLLNRPDLVTATTYYKRPGTSTFTSKVSYTDYLLYYQPSEKGYPLAKEVLQYSSATSDPMAVKKAFEYSWLGLITKETVSAPNYVAPLGALAPEPRTTETHYYEQRPYLVEYRKDPKGFMAFYEYDPFELYVSSTTDINELETTTNSDILGVQSTTVLPEGTNQITCKRWATGDGWQHPDNPSGGLFYIWSKTSGSAEILTFYNRLGQELRKVSYDVKGKKLYADKTYDSRGRLHTQTAPHYWSLTSLADVTSTFTYDVLDRVTATTTARGTSSVEYQGLAATYTDVLNRQTSQYKNVMGWLTESKDASGSSVKYEHDCVGSVIKTWHSTQPQETSIVNEYDSHGNCTKLVDPAAGTIDFKFDPFDQMVTRDDSRQALPTIFHYDVLGRMTQRTEHEGAAQFTTHWTYDNKDNGKGMLGSVTFNEHNTEYAYDELSRVAQITNQIKGVNYSQTFAYDPYGRIRRKESPDGLVLFTEYASNGEVAKIFKGGNEQGLLWSANETDNYGRLTKAMHGNGAIAETMFENDRGLITGQLVKNEVEEEVFKRLYEWDDFGNLLWRKKIAGTTTLKESFTYDNLDRLDITTLTTNGGFSWSQNLDYDQLGNIEMKLDYPQGFVFNNAQYGEDISNPYAITSADNTSPVWPLAKQTIAYNSYNKMTSITEAPYHLAISYGYDHQRTYQELTQSDVVITKKTFIGDGLEIIEKPGEGTIQKIHYLTGGDGSLFAMYVIDQNNQGKMYYVYTDHLGSPSLITDAECNVVQELSYDAWGNRRDPATWQPYTSLASIPSPLIDRGFTFHEHLYPFTLINMNGRAYDPLVGRFLSADPYIQAPDNPQNLNRYSYCLNNPLRYTDPSGEFLAIPFMIISTTAEFLSNVIQGKSNALASAFNKSMTVTNGMSSCARISFGSFSFGLDPFNIGLSVGYNNGGFSASAGFGLGGFYANASSSVAVGDFSFNLGAGYSSGFGNLIDRAATKVSGFNYSGGISYYDRANDQYFSFGGTIFSGSHPQNNLAVGYQKGDFSFRMTNDAYVGGDKARTAAAEIGIGNHTVGFNIFTTEPPDAERKSKDFKGGNEKWESPIWRKNKKERYTYSSGSRLWAGLYIGYRNGNTNSRTGIDAPWVQDFFQNGFHKHVVHSPYLNTELGPDSRLFFQTGFINSFSLYPF